MKLSRSKIAALIFLVLAGVKSFAQDGCEIALNRASDEFNAGHFYSIPALLKDCLDQNQNPEWRQRAYLLLAETYLLLEDPIGAEDSYLKVLRANPEFVAKEETDPIDLVYLSKKFTATPVFSLYGKTGPNTSIIHVIHDVNPGGEENTREKYFLRVGWHAGMGLDWHYNDRFVLSTELNYAFTSFRHEADGLFSAGEYKVEFIDRQSWISVPLIVKYSDDEGLFRPYGYGGYALSFLLGDRGSMIVEGKSVQDIESPILRFTDKRNLLNRSFLVGGGVKYKWKLNYLFVDVRYAFGLSNIVRPEERYNGMVEDWPYVDDDFRMDHLSLSFGYIHPFYKPRKLKKARTKSVLRKIKKR